MINIAKTAGLTKRARADSADSTHSSDSTDTNISTTATTTSAQVAQPGTYWSHLASSVQQAQVRRVEVSKGPYWQHLQSSVTATQQRRRDQVQAKNTYDAQTRRAIVATKEIDDWVLITDPLVEAKQTYQNGGYQSHLQQSIVAQQQYLSPPASSTPPKKTHTSHGYMQHLQSSVQQQHTHLTSKNTDYLSFLQNSVVAAQKRRVDVLLTKITYEGAGYLSHLQNSFAAATHQPAC